MRKCLHPVLRVSLATAAVFLILVSMVGPATAQQSYTSNEGGFSVTFPGSTPVDKATESIPYKDGTTGSINEFSVELDSGHISYMLMYNDYRADQANGDAQSVLANTRDGAVSGKTLLTDNAITLNGIPGRAFTAKDDTWNYSVRQYLKGKRLYQLIVVSASGHPALETDAFFNSFKFF